MKYIAASNIVKKYRTSFSLKRFFGKREIVQENLALDGLSFSVNSGEIYGILGPNGAGKTTMIKVLATILLPDAGDLEVLGYELPKHESKVKEKMGLALGEYERTFQWRITGRQNLQFFSSLFGVPGEITKDRIDETLALVGLQDKADKMFMEYSTGMKHRLAIARALLNDPELLLLDEPTAGLDAKTSREVGSTVRKLTKKGKTIVYTTHRLEEAGNLCDRILILDKGKKIAEESPDNLKKLAVETAILQLDLNQVTDEIMGEIRKIEGVKEVYSTGPSVLRIQCDAVNGAVYPILDSIKSKNIHINQINSLTPSFEDVFLKLTGGKS